MQTVMLMQAATPTVLMEEKVAMGMLSETTTLGQDVSAGLDLALSSPWTAFPLCSSRSWCS
jgi:hypothetical protein